MSFGCYKVTSQQASESVSISCTGGAGNFKHADICMREDSLGKYIKGGQNLIEDTLGKFTFLHLFANIVNLSPENGENCCCDDKSRVGDVDQF